MKLRCYALIALLMIICVTTDAQDKGQKIKPWEHGRLRVSDNQRFLQHEDGLQEQHQLHCLKIDGRVCGVIELCFDHILVLRSEN